MTAAITVNLSATLDAASGPVAIGDVLIDEASSGEYVRATTANRGARRSHGVALSAWSSTTRGAVRLFTGGVLDAAVSGLGVGTASWVRVSATARLERCTPANGDDIMGKCDVDGNVFLQPGVWDDDNYAGGGGGGGGATLPIVLTTDVSGILPAPNGGTGSASLPAGGLAGLTALASGDAASLASAQSYADAAIATERTATRTLTGATISGASNTITNVPISTGVSGLGTGVATFLATPTGANLATALTTALPATKGGTGLTSLGTNVATFLGTPSSSNLIAAITDETGTGALVFGTSPTISAPTISSTPVLSGASASTSNNAKGTCVDINPVNVQTTDATVTTLDSFTIASGSAVVVSWLVSAIQSTSANAAGYSVAACFRNNAGTVTQSGTTTVTVIGESDSAWDCTADNSTTTIRLRVTGKAATTIQWTAILTRLTVVP